MTTESPYAPPKTSVEAAPGVADIDNLKVSDRWKRRFRAMHKAGGPDLPNSKALSPEESKEISVFNIPGFFFGPFYYLAKGMWRKAIVLTVLCLIGILLIDLVLTLVGLGKFTDVTRFIAPAVFATLANRDYYCKMVLHDNGWWWRSHPAAK